MSDHSGRIVQTGGIAATAIDTSAELAAILTDETGSGALAFGPGLLVSTKTLSADGTGADGAIVGAAAGSLGAAEGVTLVAGVANKVIIPVSIYMDYIFATAAYTGGGANINVYWATQTGVQWSVTLSAANSFTAAGTREVFIHGYSTASQNGVAGAFKGASVILGAGTEITQPGTAAGTATIRTLYYLLDAA